ncbi:transposase [Epibacterium ulvae]|uniref:transposase n=1 Tax=Epibacterium ulvae TaxID=1156985 RepID=UPI003CD0C4C6
MSNWTFTKYKTTDWSAYNKTLKRRGPRSIRFEPDTTWAPPPSGKRALQCLFSDAVIQTCLTIKMVLGLPPRQTTVFVQFRVS